MKFTLKEDIFDGIVDDVPDVDMSIDEIKIEPEGPQDPESIGQSSLILQAISDCAKTIDQYNCIRANLKDENMINVIDNILVSQNNIMGQLQGILKGLSPNASEIEKGVEEVTLDMYDDLDPPTESSGAFHPLKVQTMEPIVMISEERGIIDDNKSKQSLDEMLDEDIDISTVDDEF
jgi:hypothetical protein